MTLLGFRAFFYLLGRAVLSLQSSTKFNLLWGVVRSVSPSSTPKVSEQTYFICGIIILFLSLSSTGPRAGLRGDLQELRVPRHQGLHRQAGPGDARHRPRPGGGTGRGAAGAAAAQAGAAGAAAHAAGAAAAAGGAVKQVRRPSNHISTVRSPHCRCANQAKYLVFPSYLRHFVSFPKNFSTYQ